jgi:hypothetical protein
MKKFIKLFVIIIIAGLPLISCNYLDDYLDVDLQGQMTLEEVFDKRQTTEAFLAQVYGYLPREYYPGGLTNYEWMDVPISDEALFSWLTGVGWLPWMMGTWNPSTTTNYGYTWKKDYTGINQATIFIENVDRNKEMEKRDIEVMKAEARFLRAYFYFTLLRKYGPVYVWGDRTADFTIRPENIDRHTLQQNLDFIISEYDKAIKVLPLTYEDSWAGRVTKGAAMAAKSRLLLYAARPLFNGTGLYKGMKNQYGDYIFPQSPDPNKWEDAARAAKDVIDLNLYSLYSVEMAEPLQKGIKSYMGVFFDKWNNEIIWGKWIANASDYLVRCAPPRVVKQGFGGFCPSLKLVDTYPMSSSGRYPVTGYMVDGRPIIDPLSGYSDDGFTNNWFHPIENHTSIKAHNSCVGRDARFYASVFANGFYWINTYKGKKLVTFYQGGTSSYQGSGDCVKSGYLWRRFFDPTLNHEDGNWGTMVWPYYRLSEIYLNYAEACNEKPNRDVNEALKYINLVRVRSGLNTLQQAYPEINFQQNKEALRELIRKERMVELAFENHRFNDIRTWMIAEQEVPGPNYTRDLLATNYEDSWKRTDRVFPSIRVFEPKMYFFPIHQTQLDEMKNFTQNYGW